VNPLPRQGITVKCDSRKTAAVAKQLGLALFGVSRAVAQHTGTSWRSTFQPKDLSA
jgi:hypothetical protein